MTPDIVASVRADPHLLETDQISEKADAVCHKRLSSR
jgi:hypothetical protein